MQDLRHKFLLLSYKSSPLQTTQATLAKRREGEEKEKRGEERREEKREEREKREARREKRTEDEV